MGKVLDFGGIRIERRDGPCAHPHIILDPNGQIVTCGACQRQLEPFWALIALSERYHAARESLLALRPPPVLVAEESPQIRAATPPPREPPR